jgi:membrane protein YdbS with pleckstrin-like domain
MLLRPSVKLILAAYAFCGLLEGLILAYWLVSDPRQNAALVLMLIPFAGQVMAAKRHAERLSTQLQVADGRIKFETGLFNKSTRALELTKVQDVRVDQTPLQRVLNTGDLSLETAGETGRLTLGSVDRPHAVAEELLNLARRGH